MKSYARRLTRLLLGVFLSSLGVYFSMQANVGLSPWDAFAVGVANATGMTVGAAAVLTAGLPLLIAWLMKEKIGLGAVLNAIFNGVLLDLFYMLALVPPCSGYLTGLPLLFLGMATLSLGCFFYIGAGFGCGPRDALTVALSKRGRKRPVGLIRSLMDAGVLLIGWLLQARVGIGTVLTMLCYGAVMQAVFHLLRFDVRAVMHESMFDTARVLRRHAAARKSPDTK